MESIRPPGRETKESNGHVQGWAAGQAPGLRLDGSAPLAAAHDGSALGDETGTSSALNSGPAAGNVPVPMPINTTRGPCDEARRIADCRSRKSAR